MYDAEQLSKFKLVDPRGLTLSYKFAPNVVETLGPSCPLTGTQDPEKERQKIEAVKNYSFIRYTQIIVVVVVVVDHGPWVFCCRLPATSFLSWLRHQGPEEYEKAKKAEANLKRSGSSQRVSAPPQPKIRKPTPPPLESPAIKEEEEAETDDYDTE